MTNIEGKMLVEFEIFTKCNLKISHGKIKRRFKS